MNKLHGAGENIIIELTGNFAATFIKYPGIAELWKPVKPIG